MEALASTDLKTILGPINFQTGPVPSVQDALVGGQWQQDFGGWPWGNAVVDNSHYPECPTRGELIPLGG